VTVNRVDGFTLDYVDIGEAVLRVRYGGDRPAGAVAARASTHATWHRVAPPLARTHAVVCPDLRGYGESSKVPTTADHAPYSKRAMAGDCLTLMRALGHDRFAVAGHDRGSYVAFRLALDHPAAVSHLAVIDGVPIREALARCDARFASERWRWFFMGNQPRRLSALLTPTRTLGITATRCGSTTTPMPPPAAG
jgi:haloacetate dehalogenase